MKIAESNISGCNISASRLDLKSEDRGHRLSEAGLNSSLTEIKLSPVGKTLVMRKFMAGLGGLYLLSLVNLIVDFEYDDKVQMVFYVFIGSSVLLLPSCYLAYKSPKKVTIMVLYCLFNLHLIFTDSKVYVASHHFASVSCLELIILSVSVFSTITEKFLYLTGSLANAVLGFALLLRTQETVSKLIIELFLVFLMTFFWFFHKSCQTFPSSKANESALTPLEDILELVKSTFNKLASISDNCGICKIYLDSANDSLLNVYHKLMTSKNIYSTQLEKITKNMDDEDKVFIEQNAHDSVSIQSFMGELPLTRRTRSESAIQVSKLGGILKNLGKEWNFNTFFLKECADGCPLELAGLYTLTRYKLDSTFRLNEPEVFLKDLESRYLPNPYHNSAHGADVMNSYLFLLTSSDLYSQCTDIELLAGIISCLGHDVGHPARNNRFLIITKDEIAIQYNDISVLENMHSTIVFQLIQKNKLLNELTSEQWSSFRRVSIEMILATDMSKHFDIVETFKTKYSNAADITRAEVRFDLFKMIIKASDIGHAAKTIDLHKKWCEQVIEEFYTQGDLEKKLGLPVSMYCDRETTNIGKSQSGFIKNIVSPLFLTLNTVLSSRSVETMCIDQLDENRTYWENYSDLSRKHTFVDKLDTQQTIARRRSSLPLKQN